ncbi:minor capsid protein [Adlercreutzia sp.]|uniref:minor capsid protein n=1 Tax=Adlercreutzia sp. TaxID=1872387 RepID=UPI003AB85FA0
MTVIINTPQIDSLLSPSAQKKRQEEYAMRVAFVMRKYVPRDENTLRASEPLNSKYTAGLLIWNTPYAARQYSVPMAHTTPGTCDHWDEAVARNDMPDLIRYAESLFGGK